MAYEIGFKPSALKGVINQQNEGRKKLSEQADYNRISKCCPEARSLEDRIKDWLQKS
jgi:hypothetical protein